MEKKTIKKVATKKIKPLEVIEEVVGKPKKQPVRTALKDGIKVVLMTAEKNYEFTGENLRVLFQLEPSKISGKTSISITRNGLTYTKMMKPMLLKKFLNNATYLDILEKQIVSLLK